MNYYNILSLLLNRTIKIEQQPKTAFKSLKWIPKKLVIHTIFIKLFVKKLNNENKEKTNLSFNTLCSQANLKIRGV